MMYFRFIYYLIVFFFIILKKLDKKIYFTSLTKSQEIMVWIIYLFLFKYNRQIINNNRFHYILILNEKTLKKILSMDSTSVAAMYVSCLKCLMLFFVVFH